MKVSDDGGGQNIIEKNVDMVLLENNWIWANNKNSNICGGTFGWFLIFFFYVDTRKHINNNENHVE